MPLGRRLVAQRAFDLPGVYRALGAAAPFISSAPSLLRAVFPCQLCTFSFILPSKCGTETLFSHAREVRLCGFAPALCCPLDVRFNEGCRTPEGSSASKRNRSLIDPSRPGRLSALRSFRSRIPGHAHTRRIVPANPGKRDEGGRADPARGTPAVKKQNAVMRGCGSGLCCSEDGLRALADSPFVLIMRQADHPHSAK